MDLDGSNVKQLTNGDREILASFSPDGKWVYFVTAREERKWNTIRKVSLNGGESTMVATAPDGWLLTGIDINKADGRLVYGLRLFSNSRQYKIGILPAKGEAKLIDIPTNFSVERPRWAPDNRTIALMSAVEGVPGDVWSIPVDGKGKPRQLTDFRTPGTVDPRWTADGKQLLVSRGTSISNPVLIRNTGN